MSVFKNCILRSFQTVLAGAIVIAALLAHVPRASAQAADNIFDPNEVFELILFVERQPGGKGKTEPLAGAMLGFQKGVDTYYLPLNDLAQIVGFDHTMVLEEGRAEGWYFSPENQYVIDTKEGYFTRGDERFELAPEDTIVMDFGGGFGDIYVRYEKLNELWPLELDLDYLKLKITVETPRKLPYELKREREKRRNRLLELQQQSEAGGYVVLPNDYRMFSLPVLDIYSGLTMSTDNEITGNMNVAGRNDLLGFSAEYNLNFDYANDRLETPKDIRLTMTRLAYGEDPMPLGVRRLSIGDVGAPTSELISGSNGGRGFTASSTPVKRRGSFDEVTIDGIAPPGWEIELYNNNQLLDFGVVSDTGEYRFDIDLNAGGNLVKVILYGPHGQIEERTEAFDISGLLPPGETEYDIAVVDTKDNLITLQEEQNTSLNSPDRGGIAMSANLRHGINHWLSVFGSAAQAINDFGGARDETRYVTAGANMSLGRVQTKLEGYKQLGGGDAAELRAATVMMGWNLNLRTAVLDNFESTRVGYGDRADVVRAQGRIGKRFRTAFGIAGIQMNANYNKEASGDTEKRYEISNFLSKSGSRLSNTLRLNYRNDKQTSVTGNFQVSENINRKTNARALLSYNVQPHYELVNLATNVSYRHSNKLTMGADWTHSLLTGSNNFGGSLSYDFGLFLASADASWDSESGLSMGLRASTSLAPYAKGGGYMMSSDRMAGQGAFRAALFHDADLDGIYDEGEMPIDEAYLRFDRYQSDKTDEMGLLKETGLTNNEYITVNFDRDDSPNPFLAMKEEGYIFLNRAGVSQDVAIPMVETGLVDGTVYFANGNPVPGLRLELVRADGFIAGETISTFDGFYTFQYVKPGKYFLRTANTVEASIKPVFVNVTPDNLFVYGTDLELIEHVPVEVDVAAVKGNYGSILSNLKKLQGTLSAAVNGS